MCYVSQSLGTIQAHIERTSTHSQQWPVFGRDENTYHTKPQDHATPEQHIVQQCATPDPFAPLQHDNWHLEHHGDEAIASELSCYTSHDKLVCQS